VTAYDQIEYAGVTDTGIRRPQNEDCHAALLAVDAEQWRSQGHIFLVADGMGGHAVGELASELAAGIIPHTYYKYAAEGAAPALRKAFLEANASIHSRGQQNLDFKGMGTTSTALLLQPGGAWIGHVGDSRAYRIRQGHIDQLTFDHSWVWELARRQNVSPESLKGIGANYINRSLGPDPLVQIDIEGPHPLQPGDTFVLCSDGLSNQLTDQEIGAVVTVLPPAEASRVLMHLANLRGGPDNITVVVARVRGTDGEKETPAAVHGPHVPPWLSRFAWPFPALILGVVLAALAVVLSVNQVSALSIATFALAAVALLAGLAGLAANSLRERRQSLVNPEPRSPHVYRSTACRVDRGLVDRLVAAEQALSRWAKEKNWDVDWSINQQYRDLAEGFLKQGDLPAAFREYCRSIRPFTEVILRDRFKGEEFQQLWERAPH
jgi:protein phosphatase